MMTPDEYSRRFLEQQALQPAERNATRGLCGRFLKGIKTEHFQVLSDEPGKLLSWVCSGEMLGGLLGLSPVAAMYSIGFRLDWVQCRLEDGTQFKLVVFPAADARGVVVTWEALWTLIAQSYGKEIDEAVTPFKQQLEDLDTTSGYASVLESGDTITQISNLSVAEKHKHPGFLSATKFLDIPKDERTLYHARGFLDHAVGCNHRFTGTGKSPDGDVEMMTFNKSISDIPGANMIPLQVTKSDLASFRASLKEKSKESGGST
ncbi:expressed unknown protein [Seminavis robusta]|uniref:Uncharacterized protein n=1 Tax=Seminavis robusta TaxID=568900 RepID=A0A9N8HI56_9STRA|nr:expressed unknown protein [Seminavis robusta]|eukprot:Sro482_g151780.1 n/a (262) ;mRNA; f:16816-17601